MIILQILLTFVLSSEYYVITRVNEQNKKSLLCVDTRGAYFAKLGGRNTPSRCIFKKHKNNLITEGKLHVCLDSKSSKMKGCISRGNQPIRFYWSKNHFMIKIDGKYLSYGSKINLSNNLVEVVALPDRMVKIKNMSNKFNIYRIKSKKDLEMVQVTEFLRDL